MWQKRIADDRIADKGVRASIMPQCDDDDNRSGLDDGWSLSSHLTLADILHCRMYAGLITMYVMCIKCQCRFNECLRNNPRLSI